jgi:hypothetical protein
MGRTDLTTAGAGRAGVWLRGRNLPALVQEVCHIWWHMVRSVKRSANHQDGSANHQDGSVGQVYHLVCGRAEHQARQVTPPS